MKDKFSLHPSHREFTKFAKKGYRVLGIGSAVFPGTDFPKTQQELKFSFKGLVAFYDPPKANIQEVFETFYKAGIQIKIVTGDNAATTSTIARQIGFKECLLSLGLRFYCTAK